MGAVARTSSSSSGSSAHILFAARAHALHASAPSRHAHHGVRHAIRFLLVLVAGLADRELGLDRGNAVRAAITQQSTHAFIAEPLAQRLCTTRSAEATQPVLAAEGGAFVSAMYVAEEDARKRGLLGNELLAHRQARIRPILDDFATWLAAVEPTLLPSDLLRTAVTYYRNWAALTRFVDAPAVPIDNSPTEREFQNVAKLRLAKDASATSTVSGSRLT